MTQLNINKDLQTILNNKVEDILKHLTKNAVNKLVYIGKKELTTVNNDTLVTGNNVQQDQIVNVNQFRSQFSSEVIIFEPIKEKKLLIIVLDRIQWKENNVLMVSAIIQKRAFPIYWNLLEKEDSTNLLEQQAVLRPVIRLFKTYKLVIIGDKKFCSAELGYWLQCQKIYFILR